MVIQYVSVYYVRLHYDSIAVLKLLRLQWIQMTTPEEYHLLPDKILALHSQNKCLLVV